MPWDQIIEIVMKLIEQCSQQQGRDRTRTRLRNVGLLERVVLRRALLNGGVPRAQLGAAMEQLISAAQSASDAEIDDFLKDCAA